ncbi:receptor-transporting protein 3-like [Hippoglossus hippoglossus]|uniref:receptor-transporting protein 3-like n=1 Tax=Hippoglossus hippoglossus TaxID=8267 RepID=UPI00148C198D|nr:receptor-transporting protein 3-like [Hippoglossus hippoglossus]
MAGSTEWVPTLWLETFDEMLSDDNELDYGDQWTLNFNYSQDDSVTKEQKRRGWRVYCHKAHGDFECESCAKTWHSAKIVVLFRYRLQNDRGTVIMRPFGQTCRSCENEQFERPGFPQDEVELAFNRLFSKIRKNCYGEESDDDDVDSSRKEKRTKPHESSLCEACKAGICSQAKDQECAN